MKMKRFPLVMAVLDILGRMGGWSNKDLARFFRKLFFRKVKYLRIFLFCMWGPQTKSSQPYVKNENGIFNLDEFNEVFFIQLKRLATIAYDFRVALYVDLFDHCGTKKYLDPEKTHPFYNNCNHVDGMYDRSDLAQEYRNKLAKKVIQTIGLRGTYPALKGLIKKPLHPNWFGLINEGYCGSTKSERDAFGRYWAYPLAHKLRKLGYEEKILYSAYKDAAHAISGWVSSDEHWQSEFKKGDTVRQLHGIDNVDRVDEKARGVVHGRWFATSTDGTFKRNPSKGLVVSILFYVSELCKEPFGLKGKQRYYHHHEELPLSISEIPTKVWEIDSGRDLEVYSAISRNVFGMKRPNRKVPKWLLRRYGI